MELKNDRLSLTGDRYAEVKRASESRNAEIQETVDNVTRTVETQRENASRISRKNDSIELSSGARQSTNVEETAREARVAELRAAREDGSLFDRDRLARAAERLLAGE